MSEYIAEVVQNQYGEATILKERLIRCKDCKHQKEIAMFSGDKKWYLKYCAINVSDDTGCFGNDDCYCSLAERKE